MKKQNQKTKSKKSLSKKPSSTKAKETGAAVSKPLLQKQAGTEKKGRKTQKSPKRAASAGDSPVGKITARVSQFLREAKMELKKVKWPTRKELLASTAVVIVLTLLVAFFLGLVDFGLIKIIRNVVG